MKALTNKTILITGATRGIGHAIALRCAADGANVVVAAKTVVSTPRTPGTIHDAVRDVENAGGQGLAVQVDVRDEDAIGRAVEMAVDRFGGIDAVFNNAGAIQLLPTGALPPKRYDLMHQINVRAVWMMAHHVMPHLQASKGHFVTLSPPIDLHPRWFGGHTAYTVSKYAMTMTALGLAAEWERAGVASYALWPRTAIATAAVEMLGGDALRRQSRTPAIMADAAYALLTRDNEAVTGRAWLDEQVLRDEGVEDFAAYAVEPGQEPCLDLFVTEAP